MHYTTASHIHFLACLGVLDKLYNPKSLNIIFMIFIPGHTLSSDTFIR